jgi:hypothetical protein
MKLFDSKLSNSKLHYGTITCVQCPYSPIEHSMPSGQPSRHREIDPVSDE